MIVKINVENGSKTYCFFEGDTVMQSHITELSIKEAQQVSNPDTIFMVSGDVTQKQPMLNIRLYKKHKSVQWIITNHRTYLMNDEGKTIEKLN